ncbi:hypothetical protein L1987_20626 [Smallanthus sonchifolius]|uniref:Uncharacterized protein n=1 Tax=Smallanthus sonchifolius TaxID=185202 RepID=A0ACB9IV53_9ASTR|nr:hypothetical protein L1987_20626 [Smallanthus sonchifolius]
MESEDDYRGREVEESIRILIEDDSSRSNDVRQSNVKICRVPDALRQVDQSAYNPRITSIGPLHRRSYGLEAMEEHKVTYMSRLFHRTAGSTKKNVDQITRECVQAILGVAKRARNCYSPSLTNWNDFKLTKMMVTDGCFILELLYKFKYEWMVSDSIMESFLVMQDIKRDLLLLENQIPFFILEILFGLTVKQIFISESLTDLIFNFFKDMHILSSEVKISHELTEHYHILEFFHSCYRPTATKSGPVPTRTYSATKLAVAGVRFKKQSNPDFPLTVKFKQSPLPTQTSLAIPVLHIKNSTPSILKNMIAYEQLFPLSRQYVTSFAFLMDRLIDTDDDVLLLVKSNVLRHPLGAREDVTYLFNTICVGVVHRDFSYYEEWKQLEEYCKRFWPRIFISMRGLYKSTTWKTMTVIAGVMIFILTLIQTIYTVKNA